MSYTAVIRQRGQLTIPDKVREGAYWLREGSVVEIEADEEGGKIKPAGRSKKIDWDKLWMMIRLSRSFKSKGNDVPASRFVIGDRERH